MGGGGGEWSLFKGVRGVSPLPGCKLSEFERVTALKVYNWFANRRKEMKRRANIGEGRTRSAHQEKSLVLCLRP